MKHENNKRIAVIILNYKVPNLVIDCLKSIKNQLEKNKDLIIIVDNNSKDGSVKKISKFVNKNSLNKFTKFLELPYNMGFPVANNKAIKKFKANYYLLLNSDTIVRPNTIKLLFKRLKNDEKIGIIAPQMEWPDGTPQLNNRRFLNPISEFISASRTGKITELFKKYDVILPISKEEEFAGWISFGCVLIKKEVIESVGLLEEYFLYMDDIDYCRRAWKKGWQVLYYPKARVIHLKGGVTKKDSWNIKRKPKYLYESRAKYFAKFYSLPGLWFTNIMWELGRLISLSREVFFRRKKSIAKYAWLDIWTNCFNPMKKSRYLK